MRDGFSPRTQDVVVPAGQVVTLDLPLEIGSFKEDVTVAFTAASALSAMKMETPIADIPLSVQSYTESFIKAIETTNVGDLYNYTTGVARSGNTAVDFVIRGVRASNSGNIFALDRQRGADRGDEGPDIGTVWPGPARRDHQHHHQEARGGAVQRD